MTLRACHILNFMGVSRTQLIYHLRRMGWLTLGESGSFTEQMLQRVRQAPSGLLFLHLPTPDEYVPEPFLDVFRQHPALIVISPYPPRLFTHLQLTPLGYLTEPYSFAQFSACMGRWATSFGHQ